MEFKEVKWLAQGPTVCKQHAASPLKKGMEEGCSKKAYKPVIIVIIQLVT